MKSLFAMAAIATIASGAALAQDDGNAAVQADKAAEGKLCIPITHIDHSRVLDDQTILFYMKGKDIYLNALPHRCPQLGFEQSFTYRTSLTQLCNTDIITVLFSGGGRGVDLGASCGLSKFQPITEDEAKALIEKIKADKKARKDD